MRRFSFIILPVLFTFLAGLSAHGQEDPMQGKPEPHNFFKKGQLHSSGGSGNPLLNFHGGSVLHASKAAAIFWGSQWNDATFAADKMSGLDQFFSGMSGSQYDHTPVEYYDSAGGIQAVSSYLGQLIDPSAPPSKAPRISTVVAEVCKVTVNNPDPSAVYFLYTATGAGNVNYCAWHAAGHCSNGALVQVAYMPNLDGVAGCDPADSGSGHSEGLAALANVTAHEWMEGITDPRGTGWYDSSGLENGDKCAWSFPPVLSVLSNGSQWKLQMEWSNAAYLSQTGLPNRSGQNGCIY